MSLVVFASGMFSKDNAKLKGKICDAVGRFFRTMKRHEKEGNLMMIAIGEYKTSKTCSHCLFDRMNIISSSTFHRASVVSCTRCNKLWQRDVNAAINMVW